MQPGLFAFLEDCSLTSSFEGLIPTSPTMRGTLAPGDGGSPAWSDTAEAHGGPFRKKTSLRCLSKSANFPQETTSGLQDRQCQNRQCGCVQRRDVSWGCRGLVIELLES